MSNMTRQNGNYKPYNCLLYYYSHVDQMKPDEKYAYNQIICDKTDEKTRIILQCKAKRQ